MQGVFISGGKVYHLLGDNAPGGDGYMAFKGCTINGNSIQSAESVFLLEAESRKS